MTKGEHLVFLLTEEQKIKLSTWDKEQNDAVHKRQMESSDPNTRRLSAYGPYYGAIGGHLTYCFTPTSIGMIVLIKHEGTQSEIDLTEYEAW